MDYLRASKAGIQQDLTRSLSNPELFLPEIVANFGIFSQISAIAFDPVQSLLAVGTYVSQDGSPGEVYIFGIKRVQVSFKLQRKASVKYIKFCDKKVVVLDSKHDLTIFSLESRTVATAYSPPGGVSAITAEVGLDWVFLGLQNGEVIAYDLDRNILSPFRIPNLWKERSTKPAACPVISLALHPRDVGTLLIGYLEGAVVFSFKQNKPTLFLQFELPPGAPGADSDPAFISTLRRPKVSHALWHPTGTFIMTAHEDSCMVFWDPKDGRVIQTRTLQDSHVHIPGGPLDIAATAAATTTAGLYSVREPIFKVAWCCAENADVTSLLIAGGNSTAMHAKGLTLLELGPTPPYLTSSWEVLSEHFATPKRQRILPTPTTAGVVDFCLIPRISPHYDGAHDPVAVIALLASGELALMKFPDGHPLSPTYLLPVSLSFVHPTVNIFNIVRLSRQRWLGMEEKREKPPIFLEGGSPLIKPHKRYDLRTVIQTAHHDGTLRIWDASHADELENPEMIEVDLGRVLNRTGMLTITDVSMSGATGELAVGMEAGEMVVFNWRKAAPYGTLKEVGSPDGPIVDIKARADPRIREGLLPLFLLKGNESPVVAVRMSDIGFIAVAHGNGQINVLDLRGPVVIYTNYISQISKDQHSKRHSLLPHHKHTQSSTSISTTTAESTQPPETATVLAFSILTLDDDEFSSIALHVGTSLGRVLTFKILPGSEPGGVFRAEYVGVSVSTIDEHPVVDIVPINADTGALALANQHAFASLREGVKIPGALVVPTKTEVRLFKPSTAKGAHKSWGPGSDGRANHCVSAGLVELDGYGIALVSVMSSGIGKVYSIPGLKEIKEFNLLSVSTDGGGVSGPGGIDKSRISDTIVLPTGDIVGFSTQTSITTFALFGSSPNATINTPNSPKDELYNPATPPPPRPTVSGLQWLATAAGKQYISLQELDLIIGGPDRPPSKAQVEAERKERVEQKARERAASSPAATGGSREAGSSGGEGGGAAAGGIWANLQQGFNERTKALGLMGENMDRLGESSKGFADEVARLVKDQKKKALWGGVKSKFF